MIDFNFQKQKYEIISFFQKENVSYELMKEFINFINSIYENKILFDINIEFNTFSGKIEESYFNGTGLFTKKLLKLYIHSAPDCIKKYEKFKKLKGFL